MEIGEYATKSKVYKRRDYDLALEQAQMLFNQTWLHTFGICVLLAGRVCQLSQEEISQMLSMEFQGALMLIKSGKYHAEPVNEVK